MFLVSWIYFESNSILFQVFLHQVFVILAMLGNFTETLTIDGLSNPCSNQTNQVDTTTEPNGNLYALECTIDAPFCDNSFDYGLIEEMKIDCNSIEEFIDHIEGKGFDGLVGRRSLYSISGVVKFVENVLFSCSQAQEKRRSKEMKTVGISMPDLRDLISSNFSEVREHFPNLGDSTVRRLGIPPNRGRHAAIYYHCLFPFKRLRIENNKFLFTSHSHSAFSQTNLIFEQGGHCQSLGDIVEMFSSDVSQCFNVGGTTLTSRLLIFVKFFTNLFLGITKTEDSYCYMCIPENPRRILLR